LRQRHRLGVGTENGVAVPLALGKALQDGIELRFTAPLDSSRAAAAAAAAAAARVTVSALIGSSASPTSSWRGTDPLLPLGRRDGLAPSLIIFTDAKLTA
jgi:hypothetical protein